MNLCFMHLKAGLSVRKNQSLYIDSSDGCVSVNANCGKFIGAAAKVYNNSMGTKPKVIQVIVKQGK